MKNVDQIAEEKRWERIYARGAGTARKFKITSEADIDRILHGVWKPFKRQRW